MARAGQSTGTKSGVVPKTTRRKVQSEFRGSTSRSEATGLKVNRTAEIVGWVEGGIESGELTPGTKLDERELATKFQVSKTPVREALIHLAARGIVDLRQRRGATISTMSVEQIVAMFELMAELEAMAAKLAATRMSPELRRKLNDTYVRSEKYLKDEKKYNAIDAELHEIISLGSHNEYLDEAIKNAHSRTRLYRPAPFHHPGLTTQSFREHGVILDAIANGEGDAAGQAMHAHLTSSGRIFADFIARLARVR